MPNPSTPPPPVFHPAIAAFLDHLRAKDRPRSADTYASYLAPFQVWLVERELDLLHLTTVDLMDYQRRIAERRHHRTGEPLASATRATAAIAVISLFLWMYRRGMLIRNPAAKLRLPKVPRRLTVAKDHLSQQEVIALLQTQAAVVHELPDGTIAWARERRNLALIAMALATGRRCMGLVTMRTDHLDLERNELRVDWEKGRAGRVLPVSEWCMAIQRRYLRDARHLVIGSRESPCLFPSRRTGQLCARAFVTVLEHIVAETIRRNPDLSDLPGKRISTHSLRVSYASMLFQGGCNLRSLNDLMLHTSLATTAQYTPLSIQDLRRALVLVHPRA